MAPTQPSSQEKRKTNELTLPKKVEPVKHMKKGESRVKLMAEYGVGSLTLYDFKKQKDKLLSFMASTEGTMGKIQKRKFLSRLCAHFCVRTFCLDCASVSWLHHSFLSFSHVGASHLRKPVVLRSMAPCLFLIVMCSSVNNNNNNNLDRALPLVSG